MNSFLHLPSPLYERGLISCVFTYTSADETIEPHHGHTYFLTGTLVLLPQLLITTIHKIIND
jgi:hypothetical protein